MEKKPSGKINFVQVPSIVLIQPVSFLLTPTSHITTSAILSAIGDVIEGERICLYPTVNSMHYFLFAHIFLQ